MAALERPEAILQLAADAVSAACPRALAVTMVMEGWPAHGLVGIFGSREGSAYPVAAYRRVFPRARVAFDRARVQPSQRNTWREVLGDGLQSSDELRRAPQYTDFMRAHGVFEHGRVITCLGDRPLGAVYALLPEGQPGFSGRERAALDVAVPSASSAVRLCSRLLVGDPGALAALDHLMASRADRAFVVAASGAILAASPAGRRLLERKAELVDALAVTVREAGHVSSTVHCARLDVELQVVPCAPRGAAPSYLVLVGVQTSGRGRITPRQAELLDHLEMGLSNKEIAERMGVAPETVKTWLRRLFRRAGVRNRVGLLAWAGRTGRGGACT